MTIGIVTDSTCDLPPAIVSQYDIKIVPLYINFGTESYLDQIELSREDFYARLPLAGPLPTTAMPGPQMFLQAYKALANEGVTEILSIHISRSLSALVDAARLAAREAPLPVTILDSGSLSLGTGFLAWAAAEAASEGQTMDEILALLKEQGARTRVFAVLETLDYLQRSGRMNRVLATLGNWLRIKPLLKMHDGKSTAEKIRTSEAATDRLIDLLKAQMPLEKVGLVHTHALNKAKALQHQVRDLLPGLDTFSVDITPVFGVHLGPGAIGFACVSARSEDLQSV